MLGISTSFLFNRKDIDLKACCTSCRLPSRCIPSSCVDFVQFVIRDMIQTVAKCASFKERSDIQEVS